jgi:hypothetical protein
MTECDAVSTTEILAPFSDVMYARVLSGKNAESRGRGPTVNCLTTRFAAVSMTEA